LGVLKFRLPLLCLLHLRDLELLVVLEDQAVLKEALASEVVVVDSLFQRIIFNR
jgi:hypothetical protein